MDILVFSHEYVYMREVSRISFLLKRAIIIATIFIPPEALFVPPRFGIVQANGVIERVHQVLNKLSTNV